MRSGVRCSAGVRAAPTLKRRRPAPTTIAKPSTVSGALAPWSRAMPAPITGTESPTKSAISSAEVIARRSSGAAASSTRPVVPLKTAPAPAPMSAPPTRNSARLGVDRRTDMTRSTRPTSIESMPEGEHARGRQLVVAHWETTPEEKTRNSVAPDSACDGWPSVVARKSPERPANSPFAEKAARVAAAAGMGILARGDEPVARCAAVARRTPARPSRARPPGRSARSRRARRRRGTARSAAGSPTPPDSRRAADRRRARRR